MCTLEEDIQEGETVEFSIILNDEQPFDLFKIYWINKPNGYEIARFSYPALAGFIPMTLAGNTYICILAKQLTNGKIGPTLSEFHFERNGKLDIWPKINFPTIVRSINPTSN